ncbi:uncharacterized protein FA14DRAFT_187121 [Meira miltonrushii]|uniref:Uncharacterized protein n=1 Tax=Meira miltonrushii TaxID=1280837 RepID=A0A316VI95_9BASI|nr:uncharacterized protein FA14DRAFT_187121 [Meira miltonrushii]PWN36984.1 hypothetical protein FA14DRAFT_187121 [Meira miltonrushii]
MLFLLSIIFCQLLALTLATPLRISLENELSSNVEMGTPYKVDEVLALTTWKRAEHSASSLTSRPVFVVAPPSVRSPDRAGTSTSFEASSSGGNSSPSRCKGCLPRIPISNANKARLNKVYTKTKDAISSAFSHPALSHHKIPRFESGYRERGHGTKYEGL